jgi:hypothetical protein
MRKLWLFCLVLFVFLGLSVYAQPSAYNQIRGLLSASSGLDKNYDKINELSIGINDSERTSLYNAYKMRPWVGLGSNLLLGYGIGSFVQGDTKGGQILLGVEAGGNLAVLGGFIAAGALIEDSQKNAYDDVNLQKTYFKTALVFIISGFGISVLARVAGTIRAAVYPSSYNKKLIRALGTETAISGVTFDIAPHIIPSINGVTLALIKIKIADG